MCLTREAIGAFIVCALLLTVVGLTGWFDTLMKKIPAGIASALLAGILFEIGIEIFRAAQFQNRARADDVSDLSDRQTRHAPLCDSGDADRRRRSAAGAFGLLDFSRTFRSRSRIRVHNAGVFGGGEHQHRHSAFRGRDGFAETCPASPCCARTATTPSAPLISTTGIASLLLAPFGSHGINLAAITAAICTGREAHENRDKRYTAAVWCGVFYLIAGIFGATIAALFAAFPRELVVSVAALALFGSIMSGLTNAMQDARQREAALVTFMVTASGLTLLSIGSAFCRGLVAGVVRRRSC